MLDHTTSLSALAIGAISLAISTTGVARITYDSAPVGYGRAAEQGERYLASALAPRNLRAVPAAATTWPLAPPASLAPVAVPPPASSMSPASPVSPAENSGFVGVTVHTGMPASTGIDATASAGLAIELPRLHQCGPSEAVRNGAGIRCGDAAVAKSPSLAAAEPQQSNSGEVQLSLLATDVPNEGSLTLARPPLAQAERPLTLAEHSVALAENAVEIAPGDATSRYALGAAYLQVGRFSSAATAFEDALTQGNGDERTILALAMSMAGSGRADEAVSFLTEQGSRLNETNLGISLALVGRPALGSRMLEDAIVGGASDAATRQDLAYAYTLAGRWTEARALAEIDLAPAEAHRRIARWLETSQPQALAQRIARYLQTDEPGADPGLPVRLALNPTPETMPETLLAVGAETDPLAEPPPRIADAGPLPKIDSAPIKIASSDDASENPVRHLAQKPITLVLGDSVAGYLPIHQDDASADAIRLGDLLGLFADHMDANLHAMLSASPSAQELVSFDKLEANGFAFHRDPAGKGLSLGLAEI